MHQFWRSFGLSFFAAVLLVVMSGCAASGAKDQSEAGQTGNAKVANPIVQYDSLAKAEKAAGFTFTVPEGVNVNGADYEQYYWATINRSLVEVRYGAEGNEVCYLRKAQVGATGSEFLDAAGNREDISGDYNVYDEVKTEEVVLESGESFNVTLKGSDAKFYVATWHRTDRENQQVWNYAAGIQGVPEEDLLELVKMVE
ncbi:MAG: hypothetical protein IJ230_02245 [Clostridia bacterium]|nr:hypothetical protein [Clostridia bacterium]